MLKVYLESNDRPSIMTLVGKERYYDWYVDTSSHFEVYDGDVHRNAHDTYIGNIPEGLI